LELTLSVGASAVLAVENVMRIIVPFVKANAESEHVTTLVAVPAAVEHVPVYAFMPFRAAVALAPAVLAADSTSVILV
jgi:hypothetical protein